MTTSTRDLRRRLKSLTSNATLVATVSDTAFQDNGLPPLVRQFYAVVAVNGATVSQPTAAAQVIVQAHPDASIFGFADTHNHQFANLGFGRSLIWGSAFSDTGGLGDALHSCELAHGSGGFGDIIGNFLTQSVGHDTRGFDPTSTSEFTGWPRFDTRTHQQAYYEWVQRAFEGGQRLMVMHAINTKVLCEVATARFAVQLRGHGVDRDAAARGEAARDLRRSAVGRSGQRLVPHRLLRERGAAHHQQRQDGGRPRASRWTSCSGAAATRPARSTTSGRGSTTSTISAFAICSRSGTSTTPSAARRCTTRCSTIGNFVQTGAFFAPRECSARGLPLHAAWRRVRNLRRARILSVHRGQPFPGVPDSAFAADCNSRGPARALASSSSAK